MPDTPKPPSDLPPEADRAHAKAERELRPDAPLAERLERRFGPRADPGVSLQGAAEPASDFSSEVLARLSGRQPVNSRYTLEGEVARGGMGAILRVWDEDLRRHLAMKVVLGRGEGPHSGGTPRIPDAILARFLEEAQVTGQLDHPGIVPVHELGLDAEGRVYFTMKLVRGVTLKTVFDELAAGEGGWTQTRVLSLLLRVCEAMAYAHDKQVIHRDLKPANVMVGRFGEVYVMDWGLAKILGREDPRDLRVRAEPDPNTSELRSDRRDRASETPDSPLYTMDGDVVGTPAYMSPEQAAGRLGEMGPPADVYALGAMLYHLLAGHMPYVPAGARLNNYAIWRSVQEAPPRPLHEVAPDVPAELVAICEKAMSRQAQARYANTSELAADLSAYIEGRVVRAYETGAWAEARKWVKRNRSLAASLAAAAVLAVGGLASTSYVQARGRVAEKRQRERADVKTREAEQNLALAQAQQRRAEAQTAKVLRLSDAMVLRELEAEADALWPAHPERIPALESWVQRAGALAANLPDHRARLAEMRAGGRADEREPESGSHETWRFDTPEQAWHHGVLAELIGALEVLESGLLAEDVTTAEHGWSVARRLSVARALERVFAAGGAHAQAWAQALPAIRAAYPELECTPQMGLVPLGPDPASGLWEFAHLSTGAPAERDVEGTLVLSEATGVVLVLVPGGSFWMGAQQQDPGGRNYDPQATANEGPAHEVELDAFFLSKYEMTQGQWSRLTGGNPSQYQRDRYAPTLLHPVEQLSWEDCLEWLPRTGLALPSEAQWEYGARAGTDSPWWTGAQRESLVERRATNLADRAAAREGATWAAIEDWPELDDGYALHAPVGTFSANDFGLHETVGNLWEWCLDGYDDGFYAQGPRSNPVRAWQGTTSRVSRGGSFNLPAARARSACRSNDSPSFAAFALGVRPARALEP